MTARLSIVVIVVGVAVLAFLLAREAFRQSRPSRRAIGPVVLWIGLVAQAHFIHPQQHRLYFDEDAYAGISANLLAGRAGLTLTSTATNVETEPYKWPPGFPTLMTPWIAWLGPELGPAAFNEFCGALLIAVVMAISFHLTRSIAFACAAGVLFAIPPAVGAWFRSGSAEPSAALFATLSLWAALRSAGGSGNWAAIALLSAALAPLIRLEAVLLVPALMILVRGARPLHAVLPLVGALAIVFALHAATLGQYYAAGRPESSFSLSTPASNLVANLQYLATVSPWFWLLLLLALFARPWRALAGLGSWPLLHFGVLLFYSVGQYGAPGGSRFLLFQSAALAPLAAAGLAALGASSRTLVLFLVGFTAVVLPTAKSFEASQDRQVQIPRAEHDTIRAWAASLPAHAVVESRLPYVWQNFGVYAAAPGRLAAKPAWVHVGLFSTDAERADPRGVRIETIAK